MTIEQAHLYIKLFIFQHYDENLEDVIPNVKHHGKVSDLRCDKDGDWRFNTTQPNRFVFWSRSDQIKKHGKICLRSNLNVTDTNFNILDYITIEEETL